MSQKNFASYGDMETLIAEIASNMTSDRQKIINLIYPIGSIYMSVNNINPSTLFGGTWELLGDGYLRNNASAASGGSLTSGSTTLTVEQIPSHSHTATTQNTGAHTHTLTSNSAGGHTHTATTNTTGKHKHAMGIRRSLEETTAAYGLANTNIFQGNIMISSGGNWNTGENGNHSHTLTTNNQGSHTHTATTGSYGNHTHTLTTNSIGGGKGHTHSIEPTYIGIYAFKRTA